MNSKPPEVPIIIEVRSRVQQLETHCRAAFFALGKPVSFQERNLVRRPVRTMIDAVNSALRNVLPRPKQRPKWSHLGIRPHWQQ
jgi:hypothetical protein